MASRYDIGRLLTEPAVVVGIVLAVLVLVYSVVIGQSLFIVVGIVQFAIALFVLWLFYRLVVAVEQIAEAQVTRAREVTAETEDD